MKKKTALNILTAALFFITLTAYSQHATIQPPPCEDSVFVIRCGMAVIDLEAAEAELAFCKSYSDSVYKSAAFLYDENRLLEKKLEKKRRRQKVSTSLAAGGWCAAAVLFFLLIL